MRHSFKFFIPLFILMASSVSLGKDPRNRYQIFLDITLNHGGWYEKKDIGDKLIYDIKSILQRTDIPLSQIVFHEGTDLRGNIYFTSTPDIATKVRQFMSAQNGLRRGTVTKLDSRPGEHWPQGLFAHPQPDGTCTNLLRRASRLSPQ